MKKISYLISYVNFSVLLFSLFFIGSCSSSKEVAKAEVERITTRFDYSPKSTSQAGSANITVALVNPTFGSNYNNSTILKQFSRSLGDDFLELLSSKGLTIRGPFESRGEMLYNDKQESDFIIEPEITFDLSNISRSRSRNVDKPSFGQLLVDKNAPTKVSYSYKGNGSYTSILKLTYNSINYSEKIDIKNIHLPESQFDYTGSVRWTSPNVTFFDELEQDNVVYNSFTKTLMDQYNSIFELLERQIEIEYFETIKDQAYQIDGKN